MALTRRQARHRVYNSGSNIGLARNADSIEADGVVDSFFDDDAAGEGRYKGGAIYRPNISDTDDDQIRIADIIESNKLTHQGQAYTDLADLYYEIVGLMYPHEMNECIRLALRRVYFETYMPATLWLDGDFASSSLTTGPYNWTAAQQSTVASHVATGAVVTQLGQSGKRNLLLTNSGANGYMPTSNLYVNPGDKVYAGAIGRVNGAYTASVSLYDVTQSAALWTITSSSRSFVRMARDFTIPDGCREVELRFGGVESDAATEWDCLPSHLIGREGSQIVVPSSISEQWRFLGMGPASYGRQVDEYVHNASSRQLLMWRRREDFELYPLLEEANPYTVQINRDGGAPADSELWLHVMRPYSDTEDMDGDDTSTTNAPEDLFMAAVFYEYYDTCWRKYGSTDDNWNVLRDEQGVRLASQRQARPVSRPKTPQQYLRVSV